MVSDHNKLWLPTEDFKMKTAKRRHPSDHSDQTELKSAEDGERDDVHKKAILETGSGLVLSNDLLAKIKGMPYLTKFFASFFTQHWLNVDSNDWRMSFSF